MTEMNIVELSKIGRFTLYFTPWFNQTQRTVARFCLKIDICIETYYMKVLFSY